GANSLVGGAAEDRIGLYDTTYYPLTSIIELSNGNYVVRSSDWHNGAVADAGAVTWGNGNTGVAGVVSAANSLVGSTANDRIGEVEPLPNGGYLVRSPNWDNGSVVDAGAVTWGSPAGGVAGIISAANSLVGSSRSDLVGSGVLILSNGN